MSSLNNKSRSVTLVFDSSELIKTRNEQITNQARLLVSRDGNQLTSLLNLQNHANKLAARPSSQLANECSFKEVNRYLGMELQHLLFDARFDFDANAFTAICGSIVGGGELVLLLPPKQNSCLTNTANDIEFGIHQKTLSRFVKFLYDSNFLIQNHGGTRLTFQLDQEKTSNEHLSQKFQNDQRELINKIKSCATGHSRRPLVITANRGRGKSSALGIAIAELLLDSDIEIHITAPSKNQLVIFYKHLNASLNKFGISFDKNHSFTQRLQFVPPDKIVNMNKIEGLLIVEEAGAIPTQLLTKLLARCNRLIFSTTNDGYEGNGQGFELRFKDNLRAVFPQSKFATLDIPARWAKNDLLESTLNAAFLLSTSNQKQNQAPPSENEANSLQFKLISKNELNSNNELLSEVFKLLVNAHYQTRPSDLEMLLSDPLVDIYVASSAKCIVAAALTIREGPLTAQQIDTINQNNLRVSGHLIPQSFIVHQGLDTAGKFSFMRVMRVAVSTHYRRQQVATRLISFVELSAKKQGVQMLATSFSLFTDVIAFWFKLGFIVCRVGIRKDSSTGANTGEFVKLLDKKNKRIKQFFAQVESNFNRRFCYLASSSLKRAPVEILLSIFCRQPNLQIDINQKVVDMNYIENQITAYFDRKRSLEMVEWEAFILAGFKIRELALGTSKHPKILSSEQLTLIFSKLFQRKTWLEIEQEFGFSGQKQSREAARLALQCLFNEEVNC
jgi:tRNA(Met) cytidine acetyltransferase